MGDEMEPGTATTLAAMDLAERLAAERDQLQEQIDSLKSDKNYLSELLQQQSDLANRLADDLAELQEHYEAEGKLREQAAQELIGLMHRRDELEATVADRDHKVAERDKAVEELVGALRREYPSNWRAHTSDGPEWCACCHALRGEKHMALCAIPILFKFENREFAKHTNPEAATGETG